jgi:hypothetical protein
VEGAVTNKKYVYRLQNYRVRKQRKVVFWATVAEQLIKNIFVLCHEQPKTAVGNSCTYCDEFHFVIRRMINIAVAFSLALFNSRQNFVTACVTNVT